MATVDILSMEGKKVGELELSDAVFAGPVREHLFHEAVRWQLAKRRRGNASSKDRSEVRGSTRKLYRQKGTGRARRGTLRSPLLKGGGVAFGPKPRNYDYSLPKKVRAAALRSALARRLAEQQLVVIDAFDLDEVKTRKAAAVFGNLNLANALVVDEQNHELSLSTRNLAKFKYLPVEGLNVIDILRHDALVLTRRAVEAVEGRLKP